MDIAAFVLGVLASFIVATSLRPKLRWSPAVVRSDSPSDLRPPRFYTARFRNRRRFRSVIDVRISARVRIRGLRPEFVAEWVTFEIPCDSSAIPLLRPAFHKLGGGWQFATLRLSDIEAHDLTKLPPAVRESLVEGDGELESLLTLGEQAELYFTAMCEDGFSGMRRVFISPTMTAVSRRFGAK